MGRTHFFYSPMDDPRVPQIHALVEPILAEQAMELVELRCRPQGAGLIIRLLVDKVGGVTIQQCAKANQLIGQALDAANLITESDTIEVSSPGLDRPLAGKRDFERSIGEEIWMDCAGQAGRMETLQGMVLAVQPDAVVLKTPSGNVTVPFTQVHRAQKVMRW